MKHIFALIGFLLALIVPAQADVVQAVMVPASYTVISGTTATVIKNAPGVFLGVLTTGIQTNALTCYDNASAASGTIIGTGTLATVGLGLAGLPPGGVQATAGITCQVPTAIVGTVVVFWR